MARHTLPPDMGPARDESDSELSDEDNPWEWIFQSLPDNDQPENARKRKRHDTPGKIVGARNGDFECHLGDCVLLKAEGSHEAWVGIITEFLEDDEDGEMSANFLWFSSEKEIRSKEKKRTDFLPVRETKNATAVRPLNSVALN
jgi:origin recognition complex subunit 1